MTDESSDEDTVDRGEEKAGPIAGERLAMVRREKKISVLEVAKELHLDEPKVRALERNEFEYLGAPVFAKGHLKKYAQLVEVSVDDIIADYYTLNRADAAPPLIGRAPKPVREIRLGRWLFVLLLVAVGAGLYWWFVEREMPVRPSPGTSGQVRLPQMQPDTPDDNVVTGVDSEPAPAAVTSGSAAGEVESEPEPEPERDPTPVIRDTVPPTAAAQAPIAQAEGEIRLTLAFSGDCWTEITDAEGNRLFFGLGMNGRSVDVSGTGPLSVLLGNADNAELQVNDATYRIPASSRRGNSARFSINSP